MTIPRKLALPALVLCGTLTAGGCATARQTERRLNQTAGCPVTADDTYRGTVRLAFQLIPNGDLLVRQQRLLESCLPNATIQWVKADSGGSVVRDLGARSVDLGTIGSSPTSRLLSPDLNKQVPVKVIWIQDVIGSAESLVVHDASIKSVQSLAGRTIAVPFASTAHYSLLAALDRAGLTGSRAPKLVNLEPDAILSAWLRKDIDATWVWNPVLSQLVSSGGHVVLTAEQTAREGAPTYDLSVATSDFAAKNPQVIRMWGLVQQHAVKQAAEDPERASQQMAAQLGTSAADARRQMKGLVLLDAEHQAARRYLGGGLGADLARTAAFLKDQGELTGTAPGDAYTAALDRTAIDAAMAGGR